MLVVGDKEAADRHRRAAQPHAAAAATPVSLDAFIAQLREEVRAPRRGVTDSIHEEITMPKMKTNRGAAKRFKKTGTRQDRAQQGVPRHQLSCKTRKQKRHLRKARRGRRRQRAARSAS